MNDLILNWKKISKILPREVKAANDRAPTLEEIQQLIQYPDRRIKSIIFTMVSSGIRLGAWDYIQWKHITPMKNEKGEIVAAKLVVYPGDIEQYYTFITPEAYNALNEWMNFRKSYGENITNESWVMRDIWQTTNVTYGANWGLATIPQQLKSSAIKRIIERALWEQGLRKKLSDGERRHEWKAAHGFRKFYQTTAEKYMKSINVEITMGHSIGTSSSYYKPTEKEVLDDYLKVVDALTISSNNTTLKKQVQKLEETNRTNEYIIRGKLQEKDEEIQSLKEQFSSMKNMLERLVKGLTESKDPDQVNVMSQSLFSSGVLKEM